MNMANMMSCEKQKFVYDKKFMKKVIYDLKRECKTLLVSTVIALCYSASFSHGKHDEKTERRG